METKVPWPNHNISNLPVYHKFFLCGNYGNLLVMSKTCHISEFIDVSNLIGITLVHASKPTAGDFLITKLRVCLDCLLSPLVERSLLPLVTMSYYLLDMVLIDVDLVQSHQERPMDIDVRYFSITLPCIWCSMDMMLLSTWSLLVPYDSLTLTRICLFFPSLWSKCNTMLPSSLQHLT